MTDHVKRQYRSPVRASAAAETRARIREAAGRLFVEKGYSLTTMREIAVVAGVSNRTVFSVFPTKIELLNEVIGLAIAGDDSPTPVAQRSDFQAALNERDGRAALQRFVSQGTDLFERAGALMMVGYEAAATDTEVRQAAAKGDEARAKDFGLFIRSLAEHGSLRHDLTVEEATDVMLALLSPQVHQMLRRHRGRSPNDYCSLILGTLERALLDD